MLFLEHMLERCFIYILFLYVLYKFKYTFITLFASKNVVLADFHFVIYREYLPWNTIDGKNGKSLLSLMCTAKQIQVPQHSYQQGNG
jgi:hypothetical protein